jgi:alpha-tubulin suppressor-like RCC1 family protein
MKRRTKLAALAALATLATAAPANATSVAGWGENDHAELCAGYASRPEPPVGAAGVPASTAQVVAAGGSDYFVTADGKLWACGCDVYGEVGIGSITRYVTMPVQVPISEVRQVAAFANHVVVLRADGTVWTFGANLFGTAGNGTTTHGKEVVGMAITRPQQVPGVVGAVSVAAGGPDDAAVLANGSVLAWGGNHAGEFGVSGEQTRPVRVPGLAGVESVVLAGFADISGGDLYAQLAGGSYVAMGANEDGQLGAGSSVTRSSVPIPVTAAAGAVKLAAEVLHAVAVMPDGRLLSWGANNYGQLGTHAPETCVPRPGLAAIPCARRPVQVQLGPVTDAGVGFRYTVAASAGELFSWGSDELGQTAHASSSVPVSVAGLGEATELAVGSHHALAVLVGAAPTPSIEATAEVGSAALRWVSTPVTYVWHLSWRLRGPRIPWTGVTLAPAARSYTVTGLQTGKIYEVMLTNRTWGRRRVEATPL